MNWQTLPDHIKLTILSYFTPSELEQASRTDMSTRRLVQQVRRERGRVAHQSIFLSYEAVEWALGQTPGLRAMVSMKYLVPSDVSMGRKIGSGGTNSVYLVRENPNLLMKDAGARSGHSHEYQAMVTMERLGLQTCLRSLHFSDGKLRIIMRRIEGCIDSKTIVGYQRDLKNYVNPELSLPAPNLSYGIHIKGHTLTSLMYAWDVMVERGIFFGDFQFLIDQDGEMVLNDPTSTLEKNADKGTATIIQAMIDTYEYLFHREGARQRTWREFKRYKVRTQKDRISRFGAGLQAQFNAPQFCVIDYKYDRWSPPPNCTMFVSATRKNVAGFKRVVLESGLFGYIPVEAEVPKFKMIDYSTW